MNRASEGEREGASKHTTATPSPSPLTTIATTTTTTTTPPLPTMNARKEILKRETCRTTKIMHAIPLV